VIFRKEARALEARYFGSSYGKKKGVGLTAAQLAEKRFSRHAADVLNEKHNFKMMDLCGALPVPPRGRAGSISPLSAMSRIHLAPSGQAPTTYGPFRARIHISACVRTTKGYARACTHTRTHARAPRRLMYGRPIGCHATR